MLLGIYIIRSSFTLYIQSCRKFEYSSISYFQVVAWKGVLSQSTYTKLQKMWVLLRSILSGCSMIRSPFTELIYLLFQENWALLCFIKSCPRMIKSLVTYLLETILEKFWGLLYFQVVALKGVLSPSTCTRDCGKFEISSVLDFQIVASEAVLSNSTYTQSSIKLRPPLFYCFRWYKKSFQIVHTQKIAKNSSPS